MWPRSGLSVIETLWKNHVSPSDRGVPSPPAQAIVPNAAGQTPSTAGIPEGRNRSRLFSAFTRSKQPAQSVGNTASATNLNAENTANMLGRGDWRKMQVTHADLIEELARDHAVPPAQMRQFIEALIQENNKLPDRKENHEFDIYSMQVNGKPVTVAARIKKNKIVDIARPGLLNGLASGLDKIMRAEIGADTVNLRKILPDSSFVAVPLKPVPGEVIWVNWPLLESAIALDDKMQPARRADLIQQCRNRELTPELSNALLQQYAVMVDEGKQVDTVVEKKPSSTLRKLLSSRKNAPIQKSAPIRGYADAYHLGPYFGSGRAVIPEFRGGAFIKGSGPTPLAPRRNGSHSNGLIGPRDAVLEASAGEVMAHLAGNRSTRILAIIAAEQLGGQQDDREPYPLIAVRVGNHLRPAHMLNPDKSERLFEPMRDTALRGMYGQLTDAEREHLITNGHAELAARMNQFRILHGSTDLSNVGMGGTALDYGTVGALAHTGPRFSLANATLAAPAVNYPESTNNYLFGAQHKLHAQLLEKILPENASSWSGDFRMAKDVETLAGCGLKSELAKWLVDSNSPGAHELAKAIRRIGRWFHESVSANSEKPYQRSSLMDMHRLQAALPGLFFDLEGNPRTPTTEALLQSGDPYVSPEGPPKDAEENWRSLIGLRKYAVTPENLNLVGREIDKDLATIAALYPKVMAEAQSLGVRSGRWKDRQSFARSMKARAEFENRPIEAMYPLLLRGKVKDAIARYEVSPSIDAKREMFRSLSDIIDATVSDSKRRVDDMLFNTQVFPVGEPRQGHNRFQLQKIDGMLHYLESDPGGACSLCVELPLFRLTDAQRSHMESDETEVNGLWIGVDSTQSPVTAKIVASSISAESVVRVSMRVPPYQYGALAGNLQVAGASIPLGGGNVNYSYAVPDRHELAQILSEVPRRVADWGSTVTQSHRQDLP